MTTLSNQPFVRTLHPHVFRNYLAQLTCDDAEQTNVVHKYAAFQQLSEMFNTLVNSKYDRLAWISVTRGLQYLVQALDDYSEDDTYEWQTLNIDFDLCYLQLTSNNMTDVPFDGKPIGDHCDFNYTRDNLVKSLVDYDAEYLQGSDTPIQMFIELCHNYISVILDYNSECGLTGFGNDILSKLVIVEGDDFADILPDAETQLNIDFGYDLDDGVAFSEEDLHSQDVDDEDEDNDEKVDYYGALRSLLKSSMSEAVTTVATRLIETQETYIEGVTALETTEDTIEFIVSHLDADDSARGCTQEEFLENITDDIIDLEESLSAEARETLADLESRCHEAFIVTLIETLRARKCEPLQAYGFTTERMNEICAGNKLPIYPEFYANVAGILTTFLGVPQNQIRMILEGDYFMFTYMQRTEEMVNL